MRVFSKPGFATTDMSQLTDKKASACTPQVVVLLIDDSDGIRGDIARQVTAGVQDLVIATQAVNQGFDRARYLLTIGKFGTDVVPIAIAAHPREVSVSSLAFSGGLGTANISAALRWAMNALLDSLNRCRQAPDYRERDSPPPVVIIFSNGQSSDPDIDAAARALRSVTFQGGTPNIVACGGGDVKGIGVMQLIASHSANINPEDLGEFLALPLMS